MIMLDNGWGYLCERSKRERKEILHEYAVNYVEPVLGGFPELKGKVYLALRKKDFLRNLIRYTTSLCLKTIRAAGKGI